MLQSRVVFYPGSDCRDGLAFELFTHSHAVHCVIHADVGTDLDTASVPRAAGQDTADAAWADRKPIGRGSSEVSGTRG